MAEIYLAGGCFWGLEEYFSRIPGVEKTTVGYANGQVETTNYQLIKETDHAETVQVVYDPDKITLRAILLDVYKRQLQGTTNSVVTTLTKKLLTRCV